MESRIEHVTVYAGAARVKRAAEIAVDGATEVRLGGLPLALRDDSVRLAATGDVRASGVRVVVEIAGVDASLPPADPEALDAARAEVAAGEAEVARLGRSLEALGALTPVARSDKPEAPPPAWGAAVEAQLGLVAVRAERERA